MASPWGENEHELVGWARTVEIEYDEDEAGKAATELCSNAGRYVTGTIKGRAGRQIIAALRHEHTNYDELLRALSDLLFKTQSDEEIQLQAHYIIKKRVNQLVGPLVY